MLKLVSCPEDSAQLSYLAILRLLLSDFPSKICRRTSGKTDEYFSTYGIDLREIYCDQQEIEKLSQKRV